MGWYADTDWSLDFDSIEDIKALAAAFREVEDYGCGDEDTIFLTLDTFGETSSFTWDEHDSGWTLTGWTTGKAYDVGFPVEEGGRGLYAILAKHCRGTVDWHSQDGDYWRIRFFGDGRLDSYEGKVVFPGDPEDA